ncbi:MAG: gliding motility protein GldN [Flavobacteriales bacterium]
MKNFALILTFLLLTQFSFSQDILDYSPRDGVYDKDIRDGDRQRMIQDYQYVREADVMWSTKIEREIDLREKVNQVFYYPINPINDRRNLIDVLLDGLKEGTIIGYEYTIFRPSDFGKELSQFEAENIGLIKLGIDPVETIDEVDPTTNELVRVTRTNEFGPEYKSRVKKYLVKEEWFFDKSRSVMEVRIIGICPIMDDIKDGNKIGEKNLFWVYYPQARKVLSKAEVFNHRKNDAARLTYDDIFQKRFFNSRIIKESNKYDRFINEYKVGLDALLEAEKIKEEIFNLEHDLWEY